MARGTTMKTGMAFMRKSRRFSPSTKRRKAPGPVFGSSSQFRGVGRGMLGDPRK